jgi:ubiquitin carboxyl-terminal hydrolase 47
MVYELYGIMLHSGGAHGGHYSAYIKDFESEEEGSKANPEDCWYHFNDSFVKKIAITDVISAFGQVQNTRNKKLSVNHLNAYMLLYRLVQPGESHEPISIDEIADEVI